MSAKYITVFPGKRDAYQIPISLEKTNRLELFITDIYYKGRWKKLKKIPIISALSTRFSSELNDSLIYSFPVFSIITRLSNKIIQNSKITVWEDDWYARMAVYFAKRRKCNLILYEFQAEYAFKQAFNFPIKKVLFQFHPHPAWEHPYLLEDAKSNPDLYQEVLKNTRNNLSEKYRFHTCLAWKNASHIIVASGITKKSLTIAGCPEEKIDIVPYGFYPQENSLSIVLFDKKPKKPFFLFVGSGTYRKGFHHLCNAWEKSGISDAYELIFISRTVDDLMKPYLNKKGIIWMPGVSKEILSWHYQNALCFIMPSLSEGFGQVYLEAMSNGCPIIGSRNSMLADIQDGEKHIHFVDPTSEIEISEIVPFLVEIQEGEV